MGIYSFFQSSVFFSKLFINRQDGTLNKIVSNLSIIKKIFFVNKLTAGKKKLSAQNGSFRKTFL